MFSRQSFLFTASNVLPALFFSLLCGCSVPNHSSLITTASILQISQVQNEIELSAEGRSFLNSIVQNLEKPLSIEHHYRIRVIESSEPIAFSIGNGFIILASELILRLKSEDELAFVLAHEIAHQQLNHQHTDANSLNDTLIKFEIEADTYALNLIDKAGYNNGASIEAIIHSYPANISIEQSTHPSQENRIANLWSVLNGKSHQNNSLSQTTFTSRRAFSRFKQMLRDAL